MANNNERFLFFAAVSKEEAEEHHNHGKLPYNGYSDEFLDRLEPNGNIPAGKGDIRYGESISLPLAAAGRAPASQLLRHPPSFRKWPYFPAS